MQYTLPYPPSINRYWRRSGTHIHLSNEGRSYRTKVAEAIGQVPKLTGRLDVVIDIYPPDRRRRDIDNVQKGILDALQHAGAYVDDCQIDRLLTQRRDVMPHGKAIVEIKEFGGLAI